ncbi:MAG: zf-HC2 domain-containing protein [Candidatus Eisenbacteria bacterium]|uniref:Zf-HC2 domain-containing protein n=1 Tax=Eiseniibacteriota bacterium TaxID=2212470 RepID=A0A9D6L5Y5_UNCEI|nr:zf-HC2 domain-containing protein [Candidatus Eisenbacteria bacterium]MBI3539518.1 zf-HC2 domain-containing protein [Candidatus Eisenbacteria bacterium]
MNCGHARSLFGSYWDDEITLAERDWLESHFASCERCRTEYEAFARSIELVSSLPRAEVTPGLAERALARARRATPAPDRLPVSTTPRWIPVTATAALVTIAAATALQWMGMTPAAHMANRVDPNAVQQPVLVTPAMPVGASGPANTVPAPIPVGRTAAVVDSLFDHRHDVEFVLDPVTVRKGRAHTALRLNPNVQGAKAVITF